jgi:hypothetical protein
METYAHIDPTTKKVTQVIVIKTTVLQKNGGWYVHGVFKPIEEFVLSRKSDGTPNKKNLASIGAKYDTTIGGFIPEKPFASFILDTGKCVYVAPKPMPKDGKMYLWDEKSGAWKADLSATIINK